MAKRWWFQASIGSGAAAWLRGSSGPKWASRGHGVPMGGAVPELRALEGAQTRAHGRGGEVSDVVWGAVTPFRSVFAGSGTILEELEGSSPESDGGIEKVLRNGRIWR